MYARSLVNLRYNSDVPPAARNSAQRTVRPEDCYRPMRCSFSWDRASGGSDDSQQGTEAEAQTSREACAARGGLGTKEGSPRKRKGSPNVRNGASVPWPRAPSKGRGSFGLEYLRSLDLSDGGRSRLGPMAPDTSTHSSAENCQSLEARTPTQLTGVRAGKLGARTAKPPAVAQIISQSSGRKISLQFVLSPARSLLAHEPL
jgi:hypothetical protein